MKERLSSQPPAAASHLSLDHQIMSAIMLGELSAHKHNSVPLLMEMARKTTTTTAVNGGTEDTLSDKGAGTPSKTPALFHRGAQLT
ncbi:unnamed protein product [Heligmosomoides polygyrus]|uniref:Uncharacterized protein n=1 Tax=Heligmosomoides polygyrus TaxID=6339 RepID=A0A183FF26_HELPZ|nr:unnamed protein product [Heligmosomoides polygyrus]